MLRIKYVLYFIICAFAANGQEIRTALERNLLLNSISTVDIVKNKDLAKKNSGIDFPFVDFFKQSNINPDTSKWLDSLVKIDNKLASFNSLNASNIVYSGTSGMADVLTTLPFTDINHNRPLYVSFNYSTGTTWIPGDSLSLEIKNQTGNWQQLWIFNGNMPWNAEVYLDLDDKSISVDNFQFRFILYTTYNTSNTNTFTLSNVVLNQKGALPLFTNFKTPINYRQVLIPDFSKMISFNNEIIAGDTLGFAFGNMVVFNMLDEDQKTYLNANGQYGGGDTLISVPLDMLSFDYDDSVYLSFEYRGISNMANTDSLILETINNLGQWQRTWVTKSPTDTFFREAITSSINRGRNRHSYFQFRIINNGNYLSNSNSVWYISAVKITNKITLPFVDDFSASRIYPDRKKWTDKLVYINNDFPVGQPSLNVATFDGLDANGNSYSKLPIRAYSDFLTSHSINLLGLQPVDSVQLSFYCQYEPQGTTKQVFPDDSLILEFRSTKSDRDVWENVWSVSAANVRLDTFEKFTVTVNSIRFLHDDFQFRFKIKGSLTGNLSQWHLDYVIFNKGRKVNEPNLDVAITNTPGTILKEYRSMPWSHYITDKNKYCNDNESFKIKNHSNLNYAVDYFRTMLKPDFDTLDKYNNIQPTIFAYSDTLLKINKKVLYDFSTESDSMIFTNNYRIKISGSANDEITTNDSLSTRTIFSNYFAYDDGTAEAGYGIKNKTNASVSLAFNLEHPDTLFGIYVFFNQSETDVSTQRFNLMVWENISPLLQPATMDKVLYRQEISKPIYINKLNGFASFKIDPPLPVKTGFLIGWEQVSAFVLNVGLDENYYKNGISAVNENMFYKTDGRWYPTEIPGALMMRPVVGKWIDYVSSVNDLKKHETMEIGVYPNPANNFVRVDFGIETNFKISLFDLMGRQVTESQNNNGLLNLPAGLNGLYILKVESGDRQKSAIKKLLINQN